MILMIYINDRIHGNIEIDNIAQSIIDTPEFQRLRRISQTGVLQWIFPSANHSRFEHSIGVYHLAKEFAKNLLEKYKLKNKEKLIEIISIAGLIHDLGHLAFSHLFELFLKNNNITFHHEELSQKLFKHICKKYKIKLSDIDIQNIIDIIHPPEDWEKGFIWNDKNIGIWVYQIVANPLNGIDVDKFDYLLRDSISCGINTNFHYDRIIKMSKIIDNEIVYPEKLKYNIFEMFLTRYKMHQQIYNHKTVKALEILIMNIFKELNILDLTYKIHTLDILQITDNIIYKYDNKNIKNILYKIDSRNFPKITTETSAKYKIPIKIGMTSDDFHPLLKIKYFNKDNKIFNLKLQDYGILATNSFSENITLFYE